MNKTERNESVASLTEKFKGSPTLYVTDFSGMNVLRMTEFRRRLRGAGARYVVVKNTLAQRALAANRITMLDNHLAGPIGFVLAGADPVPAAKVLLDFAKEFELPAVKAGLVDGAAVSPEHVKRLGAIPPRQVLLAQLAGSLNGLLYQFVGVLEALREQRSAAS
jgi:large subunit ribosomal protein L10